MAQFSGLLSSVLMTLPLVAIPVIAIVGLPSGESTSEASDESEQDFGDFGDIQSSAPLFDASASGDDEAENAVEIADVHANLSNTPQTISSPTDADPFGDSHSDFDHHTDSDHIAAQSSHHEHSDKQSHRSDSPHEDDPNPFVDSADIVETSADEATTKDTSEWEAALNELKALGVQNYAFEKSDIPGEIFFSCSLRTSSNVVQRFEAEGTSRNAAAQDVLKQIQSWQQTRF